MGKRIEVSSHPIFQIYIPNTLIPKASLFCKNSKDEKIFILGFVEEIPPYEQEESSGKVTPTEKNVAVNFVGLLVGTSPHGCTLPHQKGIEIEEVHIIGQIITNDKTDGARGEDCYEELSQQREDGCPPVWLTMRLMGSESEGRSLGIEHICWEDISLFPDPHSLILLDYEPEVLTWVALQEPSPLPSILIKGFTFTYPQVVGLTFIPLIFPSTSTKLSQMNEVSYSNKKEQNSSQPSILLKPLLRSAGFKQLHCKINRFSSILRGEAAGIELADVICLLVLDIILGLLFTEFLNGYPHFYSILHSKIEQLLKIILKLLNWLRGSPAGLKLNSALNSLLWRFFSYHLHLWANYIGILEPILSLILWVIVKIGALGLSCQISLIQDVLSIATFHVYCLYIYATRLFAVQTMAIKSLGRLFLGRKWNPLRNRVDHVTLSKSEMFLSALAFTIGLFLAPTTLIYYVVFLFLRVPVLAVEWVLSYFVHLLNSLEIVRGIFVWSNSPRVANEMYLKRGERNSEILTFEIAVHNNGMGERRKGDFPKALSVNSIVNVIKQMIQGQVLH